MLQIHSVRQIQDMQVGKINYFLQIFPIYGPIEENGEDVWSVNPLVADLEQAIDIAFSVKTTTFVSNANGMEPQEALTDVVYPFTGSALPQLLPATCGGLPCYFVDLDFEVDIPVAKGQMISPVEDPEDPLSTSTEHLQISFLGDPAS